jgi:hypothetical protein
MVIQPELPERGETTMERLEISFDIPSDANEAAQEFPRHQRFTREQVELMARKLYPEVAAKAETGGATAGTAAAVFDLLFDVFGVLNDLTGDGEDQLAQLQELYFHGPTIVPPFNSEVLREHVSGDAYEDQGQDN